MAVIQDLSDRIIKNVEQVIVGKRREVQLAIVAILSQGHILIEDVPGVGKTMLARSIARSIGATFSRIQFTPDLLPSDVTGVSIFSQETRSFEFRPGPIMAQIVLTDEINRATPKTQSALLECMEERQVTVDEHTYRLPEPFIVMATQNPIEFEGTFPLPEAQLDRFLMRITLGHPSPSEEIEILDAQHHEHPLDRLGQVAEAAQVIEAQNLVKEIYVDAQVREYIVAVVQATRVIPDVFLGASPRGSLGLFRAGQALAAVQGRDFVTPDDIKALAEAVLAHRIIISPSARIRNLDTRQVVRQVLESIPVPGTRIRPEKR
ncbi:MAG: AAA family ATPase [Anaerolineae bacterium]|nr:MoxR family ATPase [Chloroflexota bacterium]